MVALTQSGFLFSAVPRGDVMQRYQATTQGFLQLDLAGCQDIQQQLLRTPYSTRGHYEHLVGKGVGCCLGPLGLVKSLVALDDLSSLQICRHRCSTL